MIKGGDSDSKQPCKLLFSRINNQRYAMSSIRNQLTLRPVLFYLIIWR